MRRHGVRAELCQSDRPSFLVLIDTEGDDLWAKPRDITTENSRYLPRFQSLCERYGLKPTYMTNWEMAHCPVFREFAADALARGQAEIGMHLHAWNTPPLVPLTNDDFHHQPYLTEYPAQILREKVQTMTRKLEDVFETRITSHRGGRSAFSAVYARALVDLDYCVDCSVSPHVSWRMYKGDPAGPGGPDFTRFREQPYFLDLNNIRLPGDSQLLEVPLTILAPTYSRFARVARDLAQGASRFAVRIVRHFYPRYVRMIPNGRNIRLMLAALDTAVRDGRDHVAMSLHSSELMPGGSPTFPDKQSIEKLYDDLDRLFSAAAASFQGRTAAEYHDHFVARRGAGSTRRATTAASA